MNSQVPPALVTLLQSHRVAPPHRPTPWGGRWLGKCQGKAQKLWVSVAFCPCKGEVVGSQGLWLRPLLPHRPAWAPCSWLLRPFPSLSTLKMLDPHQHPPAPLCLCPDLHQAQLLSSCSWWEIAAGLSQAQAYLQGSKGAEIPLGSH